MAYLDFLWTDEIVAHIAEHGVSQDDFEQVVCHPYSRGYSRSSGLPAVWGNTADGRYIMAVYEELDETTVVAGDRLRSPRAAIGRTMAERQARRTTREITPAEQERLVRQRQQIAQELPEMTARDQMRKEAREEATLSGELRRAVHASELALSVIAARAGVAPLTLDDFLTGGLAGRRSLPDGNLVHPRRRPPPP